MSPFVLVNAASVGLLFLPGTVHAVLDVAVTVSPDPAPAGGRIQVQVTVTNPAGSPSGDVRLELAFPANLNSLSDSALSDLGDCTNVDSFSSSCNSGETVVWDIGILPAGANKVVSIPPVVRSNALDGELIRFFGFATNDAGDRTFVRATTRIGAANDFDNDGIQDADDLDDDNDGIPDNFETANGLNPFDPSTRPLTMTTTGWIISGNSMPARISMTQAATGMGSAMPSIMPSRPRICAVARMPCWPTRTC